ncbi:hypothetical protein ACVWY2_006053 [Bradyrhizobium sp. JR6.1]
MAVEVDAHAGPVESGRNLLDVSRFAGAVIAGDHHAAVLGKAGEDRERGGAVEAIVAVDFRHMRIDFGIGRNFQIAIDPEDLPNRHLHVGQPDGFLRFGLDGRRHSSSEVPGIPETRFRSFGCGWGATHKPSREHRPAEAHGQIKVPLLYHKDRRETRFLEGCSANPAVLSP